MSSQINGHRRKQPVSPYIVVVFACLLPLGLCGFGIWLPKFINDLRLSTFAIHLYNYPLPPNTTVVSRYAELSKVGNGSNCWYEVEQSMVSTLSRSEIEHYYEGVMLPRVSFGRQWDELFGSPTVMNVRLEFNESKSDEDAQYFTLTLFDIGLDITLDYRCH